MEINKIYNEDCIETMARMPTRFIDLVVTSPPYDTLREYDGFIFDFKKIAQNLYRVVKFGGIVVWVVADETVDGSESCTSFEQVLYFKKIGFSLYDTMIFQKNNFIPLTHRRYEQAFEYMFVFSKGRPKTFNPIMEKCKNPGKIVKYTGNGNFIHKQAMRMHDRESYVLRETKQHSNIFNYTIGVDRLGHPAPFPEQLAIDHIISWSNENEIVYDPFAGSGTTCVCAKRLNRSFVGSETSDKYCKIISDRFEAETNKKISKMKKSPKTKEV